jgi:hypothetical protein
MHGDEDDLSKKPVIQFGFGHDDCCSTVQDWSEFFYRVALLA